MADQIISIEAIRERARAAFIRNKRRDEHGMNWHALALPTWLAEYDRMAERASGPQLHTAPAAGARVDARQGGASC